MNLTVCKKICNECPFRKESLPGWLGSHTIEEIQNTMQWEGLFSCHKQRGDNQKENEERILSGGQNICRGFIVSAINSCKSFGQNPRTGKELKRIQEDVRQETSQEDRSKILSKWGFKEHHEKYL